MSKLIRKNGKDPNSFNMKWYIEQARIQLNNSIIEAPENNNVILTFLFLIFYSGKLM